MVIFIEIDCMLKGLGPRAVVDFNVLLVEGMGVFFKPCLCCAWEGFLKIMRRSIGRFFVADQKPPRRRALFYD